MFQLRLSGENICLGSVGIIVESPSGTKSWLKMPLDHFASADNGYYVAKGGFEGFGLGSYAFYGESAKGTWKIYSAASNPSFFPNTTQGNPKICSVAPASGTIANNAKLLVEARIISQ